MHTPTLAGSTDPARMDWPALGLEVKAILERTASHDR